MGLSRREKHAMIKRRTASSTLMKNLIKSFVLKQKRFVLLALSDSKVSFISFVLEAFVELDILKFKSFLSLDSNRSKLKPPLKLH